MAAGDSSNLGTSQVKLNGVLCLLTWQAIFSTDIK